MKNKLKVETVFIQEATFPLRWKLQKQLCSVFLAHCGLLDSHSYHKHTPDIHKQKPEVPDLHVDNAANCQALVKLIYC